MATKKNNAIKRNNSKKSAIIIALAAATGASVQQTNAAYQDAMRDMAHEFGRGHVYSVQYTWDPFDGLYA